MDDNAGPFCNGRRHREARSSVCVLSGQQVQIIEPSSVRYDPQCGKKYTICPAAVGSAHPRSRARQARTAANPAASGHFYTQSSVTTTAATRQNRGGLRVKILNLDPAGVAISRKAHKRDGFQQETNGCSSSTRVDRITTKYMLRGLYEAIEHQN